MAKRRPDAQNTPPAVPLHAEGLADRIKTTCRQRKPVIQAKQLFPVPSPTTHDKSRGRKLTKNKIRCIVNSISVQTRAQTKSFLSKISTKRVLRGRRAKGRDCVEIPPPPLPSTLPAPSAADPTPSSSSGTVATLPPRPASSPGSSSKRSSSGPWDLRVLREKVKVETPSDSFSGASSDQLLLRRADDEASVSGGPSAIEAASGDSNVKTDREQRGGGDGHRDNNSGVEDNDGSDNEEGDQDGQPDLPHGEGQGAGSGEEEGDSDGSEGEEEGEDAEEEEQDGGCRCTSNWSCGGHACRKRAESPSPKLLLGRKRSLNNADDHSGDNSNDSSSPPKRQRSTSRSRSALWPSSRGAMASPPPATCKASRQRIPSREHPPPKLAGWLDTFKSWSNAERMMAIDDLIALCEPSQVRHMMHVIEPQFQRDFISLLPKELALYVLSFLEPRDLLRAAQTCHYWRILCEDNLLWREKCREEGIDETLVYGSRLRRRPGQRSPCKALYMRQSQIEHNWRKGVTRPPKILKGHDDHVITCLEFCGQRIVSGSDDNTLKVWSVITGKCLRNLVGHTGGVWSSQMAGNIIISGSTDRTLKVWNADTGVLKHTLYGHTSTVRCMSLCGNIVVSGSRDATLRVWDIESGHCLHTLMGHVAAVRCVQYDGRRIVSGAYDYTVRVWDPDTENCLHTLQGHSNRVYSLQFDGIHVVSGSLDTSIRVWDVETGSCLHTLIGHQSLTSGLELKDNILVSGNADSTVKVWDITNGQCLQTLQGPNKHMSAVTCLQFSKKFVITSSDDGTVKIWDLKTGEFLRNLVSLDSGGSGGVVWRLRCNNTKLVCAVGSRNGTEETKLMVLDFDVDDKKFS